MGGDVAGIGLKVIVAATLCVSGFPPAQAQSGAARSRLEYVWPLIRDSYALPVDMALLAHAAIGAIRPMTELDDEAWSCCQSTVAAASGPRSNPSDPFADIIGALGCAELDRRSGAEAEKIIDAAIGAMIAKLDAHSRWLTREDVAAMYSRPQAPASVGLTVKRDKDGFLVLWAASDGPAAQAGIGSNDTLVAIDGATTADMSVDEAIAKLRGLEGSALTVRIRRPDGQTRDVPLHRRIVSAAGMDLQAERRGSVLIFRLSGLPNGVAEAIKRQVVSQRQAPSAVILDLRDNSGGLLAESIAIADLFLDKGLIVTSRGRTKRDVEIYSARKGQIAMALPVIVLVNGGTAAGAEILAAALQDNKRATVFGQTSIGAGSVQTIIPVDAHHMLRLTTSYEYRPDGRRLSEAPVVPDCPSDRAPDALLDDAITIGPRGLTSCSAPNGVGSSSPG